MRRAWARSATARRTSRCSRSMPAAARSGRSVLAPPGVPAERALALRNAFQAMVKDPEFVADIQRLNVELDPLPGEQVGDLVIRTLNVPAAVRERAKLAFGR